MNFSYEVFITVLTVSSCYQLYSIILSKLQLNVEGPPSKEMFKWSQIRLSSQTPENCEGKCLSINLVSRPSDSYVLNVLNSACNIENVGWPGDEATFPYLLQCMYNHRFLIFKLSNYSIMYSRKFFMSSIFMDSLSLIHENRENWIPRKIFTILYGMSRTLVELLWG
jgi:hypothetical protein